MNLMGFASGSLLALEVKHGMAFNALRFNVLQELFGMAPFAQQTML